MFLAVVSLLLAAGPVAAAGPEAELRREWIAAADFGAATLEGGEQGFSLRWPVGGSQAGFAWHLDYAYTRYEYRGLSTRNRDLHRLELPLLWQGGALRRHHFELRPVIATSSNVFKDLFTRGSRDDFMLHGRWYIQPVVSGEAWRWRAGLARDDVFGEARFYPLVAVLHHGSASQLELGWPWSRVARQLGPGLEAAAELGPAGASWHVVSDERDGADFDYRVEAWRASLSLSWGRTTGWAAAARTGLEFNRRHRLVDDLGAIVDRTAEDAGFVEVAFSYRW